MTDSTENPKPPVKPVVVKAGAVSFGPPPDMRHRGNGQAGSIIVDEIMKLLPPREGINPDTNESMTEYSTVFIAGLEKTSQVSSKLTEMRKRGDIVDDVAHTVRVFTCKVLFEKDEATGEDVKGIRIWRLEDQPIATE